MFRIAFLLLVFCCATSVLAQNNSTASSEITTDELVDTFRTLISVHQSIERGEDDQRNLRRKIKRLSSLDERDKLRQELTDVGSRVGELERDLEEIATGVELKTFNTRVKMKFDWAEELQDLIGPIVHELRGLTARPRELERLRREVDYYERKRLPAFKGAIDNLTVLLDGVPRALLAIKKEEKQKSAQSKLAHKEVNEDKSRITTLEKELSALTPENNEQRTKLQESIARLKARIELNETVAKKADGLVATLRASQRAMNKLINRLKEIRSKWTDEREEAQNNLTVARHQLSEKLNEKIPFWQSAHNLFAIFFKSRGRNLILALVTLVLVFLAFRLVHRFIYRFSPLHRERQRSFYIRLADVFFHILTLVGTTGAFLVVLYMYGDWVLLGLSMILVFGVAWAASRGLPLFWTQTQLLLNLGTVREGERVIIDGLPWKVDAINIYTRLSNPALSGGRLRVPIQDLVEMRSRPVGDHEPWFPSREGDWVLLGDGTYGKVVVQTPEMVQLVLFGGTKKTYGTLNFLSQVPQNISLGFCLPITFGVDYEHQKIVTKEIPGKLLSDVKESLKQADKEKFLDSLKVEFKEAGASSLDLVIIAFFKGNAADQYNGLRRLIQRAAVESCNRHGWGIPFPQLTVHQA